MTCDCGDDSVCNCGGCQTCCLCYASNPKKPLPGWTDQIPEEMILCKCVECENYLVDIEKSEPIEVDEFGDKRIAGRIVSDRELSALKSAPKVHTRLAGRPICQRCQNVSYGKISGISGGMAGPSDPGMSPGQEGAYSRGESRRRRNPELATQRYYAPSDVAEMLRIIRERGMTEVDVRRQMAQCGSSPRGMAVRAVMEAALRKMQQGSIYGRRNPDTSIPYWVPSIRVCRWCDRALIDGRCPNPHHNEPNLENDSWETQSWHLGDD